MRLGDDMSRREVQAREPCDYYTPTSAVAPVVSSGCDRN